ncbi:hypothetical protein BJ875DRAFT_254485 [Amylocarpus encephaloides]|uniref:NAD(P)-binding protein n=1 Tax=Amylocarpus encephaloides TaxID=45428 RepID=A0A9P7YLY5_9HELO|nr:hypothetical protein BJ875DRAFT_254485 [Amylocarpus encephaloides]
MPLTVLSDGDVKTLLSQLTKQDVEHLQGSLTQSLHEYSTRTNKEGCCSNNQLERTVLESHKGTTTLFMPSMSSAGIGMKVVTLAASKPPASPSDLESPQAVTTPQGALALMGADGKPFGFLNAEELTAFRTALASSLLLIRRNKVKNIVVFGVGKQAYWHVRLALILFGASIKHVQFVNRDFSARARDCMRGFVQYNPAVKEVEGWGGATFGMLTPGYGEYQRLLKAQLRQSDVIFTTTPSTEPLFDHQYLTNTEGRKKGRLIVAIGSYKQHMIELPHELITQATKRHGSGHHFHKHSQEGSAIIVDTLACVTQTGELTQAGIKETQTIELGELLLLERMDSDDSSAIDESPPSPFESPKRSLGSRHLGDDSKAISPPINSKDSSSKPRRSSAPPSRKASPSPHRRSDSNSTPGSASTALFHKRSDSVSSTSPKKRRAQTAKEEEMCRWLRSGNVIYKSVGFGLLDQVVGSDLVTLARNNNVGVTVEDF